MYKPIQQNIKMRGELRIVRRDSATGRILNIYDKRNLITFGAGELIVKLLAPNAAFGGSVQQQSQIKSLRLGTSNLTPQRTDTDLSAEAVVSGNPVRIELLDANRIVGAAGTVEFQGALGTTDGNGVTYREAGLFSRGTANDPLLTTGATLFSHVVFPDEPKTAAITLDFRWRITFSV